MILRSGLLTRPNMASAVTQRDMLCSTKHMCLNAQLSGLTAVPGDLTFTSCAKLCLFAFWNTRWNLFAICFKSWFVFLLLT
jgi:hypothetical protein